MENLSISISEDSIDRTITLLSVSGSIDTTTAPDFEKKFQSVLKDNKFKLVMDLKDVNYISSAGWGIFVSEIKRIRTKKGDLVLSGMSPEVMEVFQLLEFNSILKAFPNVDAAVKRGFGVE